MRFRTDNQREAVYLRLGRLAGLYRIWFNEQSKEKLRGLYADAVLSGEGGKILRSALAERIINGGNLRR
jgi:hypothetical protein